MTKVCGSRLSVTGISFNRLYQPLLWLQENMPKEFSLFLAETRDLGEITVDQDIYFQCSTGGKLHYDIFTKMKKFNEKAVDKGLCSPMKFIFDYDDSIMDVGPDNPAYIFSGTEECIVEFGPYMKEPIKIEWIDKQTVKEVNGDNWIFNIERNKSLIKYTKQVKSFADALVCTTPYLAEKLKIDNPNVYVIPNAIDLSLYKNGVSTDDGIVRIGWAFSSSHWEDYFDILPALTEVINSRDDVELVLLTRDDTPTNELDMNKVEIYPYTSILDGYHKLMGKLNLDIGLAHLTDTEFNKCKSPLKFLEYSAIGAATLAPNILYNDYIEDGETGSIYNSHEEFKVKLNQLIDNKKLRKKLASNALTYVDTNYSIEKIAPLYLDMFKKVLG